jgi:hypothetical protein
MKTGTYSAILFLCMLPLCVISQVKPLPKDTLKPSVAPAANLNHGLPLPNDTGKPAPVVIIPPTPPAPDTNIRIFAPSVVKNTVQKIYDFQRYNHGTSPGFRVQIDFGQEKNAVYTVKSNFSGKYPAIPSYITYKQPYFRVSVGDFRTRLDAVRFLKTVKKDYPASFVVADKITPPPL